jgi:hypothetical protein
VATSQNGWPVLFDSNGTAVYTIGSADRQIRLVAGPGGEMLADFFRWFDASIRDIDPGILDEWGWAVRPIRGQVSGYSNHASATAGDVDATKWPIGSAPESYLTAAEIAKIRVKLREYRGCIRWGGDYIGRKDPMHFELDEDPATVARVWAETKGVSDVGILDEQLKRSGPMGFVMSVRDALADSLLILRQLNVKSDSLAKASAREAASLAALEASVKALAESKGVDPDVLLETLQAKVDEALADIRVTLAPVPKE